MTRTDQANAELMEAGVPDAVIKKAEWTIEHGPGINPLNTRNEALQAPSITKDGWTIVPFVHLVFDDDGNELVGELSWSATAIKARPGTRKRKR